MSRDYRPVRTAVLNQAIVGRFSKWRKGEVVKVHTVKGYSWVSIEKMKRKRSGILKEGLTCCNEIVGVSKKLLKFVD